VALVFESKDDEAEWDEEEYRLSEKSVSNLRFVDHCGSLT
jgi:hypothetical protein